MFDVTVDKKELKKIIEMSSKIAATHYGRNANKVILKTEKDTQELKIEATNLNHFLTSKMKYSIKEAQDPNTNDESKIVDAKNLFNIIKQCPTEEIRLFEKEENSVTIKSGPSFEASLAKFEDLDGNFEKSDLIANISLPMADFLKGLKIVSKYILSSINKNRKNHILFSLQSVCIDFDKTHAILQASDADIGAIYKIKSSHLSELNLKESRYLLSNKCVLNLITFIEKMCSGNDIHIDIASDTLTFWSGKEHNFTARKECGKFPNLTSLFQLEKYSSIQLKRSELIEKFKNLKPFLSNQSNLCSFSIESEVFIIKINDKTTTIQNEIHLSKSDFKELPDYEINIKGINLMSILQILEAKHIFFMFQPSGNTAPVLFKGEQEDSEFISIYANNQKKTNGG